MTDHFSRQGYLLFEDGTRFDGDRLVGPSGVCGEAVFNTSHSGYQEILSDPSYHRQIMVFTTPHIGNVGVNSEDMESSQIQAAGAVVRDLVMTPRSWRAEKPLHVWTEENGVPLLAGANTRAITVHIRNHGAMRVGFFDADVDTQEALEIVRESPSMVGADLTSQVSCDSAYPFDPGELSEEWHPAARLGEGLSVGVIDYGVKTNILRELQRRGCKVEVLPATMPAGEILERDLDGVLLSNGPGDPEPLAFAVDTARSLMQQMPVFGICLGHQILAQAAGLKTFKLPFGHRGANHPVRCEADLTVEITSQNHGFAVDATGVTAPWRVTHINLNDGTVEGLAHDELPVFSIQYHPEASPGPHEGHTYFDHFIRLIQHAKA
jgi:carbamoyl-phosphate synthase small subunit